jgi:hypothetical protein
MQACVKISTCRHCGPVVIQGALYLVGPFMALRFTAIGAPLVGRRVRISMLVGR